MTRADMHSLLAALLLSAPLASIACGSGEMKANDPVATPEVAVAPVAAVEQPLARFIRATGTLMAEEHSEVAAETAGRVVAAPIERGSRVNQGDEMVRLSPTETEAQLKEAEANAAQIEARLGIAGGTGFDANAVPEVQNARASFELAQGEFARIKSLLDQRVVSQSEYDQRRTQMEASRQQVEAPARAWSWRRRPGRTLTCEPHSVASWRSGSCRRVTTSPRACASPLSSA